MSDQNTPKFSREQFPTVNLDFGGATQKMTWDELADEVKRLTDALEQATRWIPVSERLPEVEPAHGVPACSKEFLLIWPRTTNCQTALYFTDCGFARDGKALDWVTHWMPLPQFTRSPTDA